MQKCFTVNVSHNVWRIVQEPWDDKLLMETAKRLTDTGQITEFGIHLDLKDYEIESSINSK